MKKIICSSVFSLSSFFLIIAILASVILVNIFDINTYEKEFAKFNTAEEVGMSSKDLRNTMIVLIDYMSGERDDMVTSATVNGVKREVFNETEKAHMVDVRNLCVFAKELSFYSFISVFSAFLIMFLVVFFFFKKQKENTLRQRFSSSFLFCFKSALNTYKITALVFLAVVVCIGIFAAVDFRMFWRTFHKLAFNNNLWMLSPDDDILMQMMTPRQFFADIIFKIALWFIGIFGTTVIGSFLISHFLKKRKSI